MKTKTKLNVKLLRRIQKHITEEPRRFFMDGYEAHYDVITGEWEHDVWFKYHPDLASSPPPCNTAACIAGWANGLTGAERSQWSDVDRAAKHLGLDFTQRAPVFGVHAWPQPFATRYAKASTPRLRAKIACERIDYLIKTGL